MVEVPSTSAAVDTATPLIPSKRKTGVGKRIFLMSPLHHHYQKKGYAEPKIVTRFWIVAILLAIVSIVTLKVR